MRRLVPVLVVALVALFAMPVAATPPDASGPIVMRTPDIFALWLPHDGMGLALGIDPIEFCTTGFFPHLVPLQRITVSEGDPDRLIDLRKGEVQASVWPFTVIDCGLFLTEDPLATGFAYAVDTDNDWFGGHVNANAWGFSAHGTLYDGEGDARRLSAHLRCVSGVTCSSKLKLGK